MQATRRVIFQVAHINYCRRLAIKNQTLLPKCVPVTVINQQSCGLSSSVAPPVIEGTAKEYSTKIQQLVDDISCLNLLEVADLNELLKKTLNIQDTPMMAMGAMPASVAKGEEEEEAPIREKTSFTVKLSTFDAGKKIQLIKEIKKVVEGLNLVQAKKFVESVPQIVKADVTKEEAESLKAALTAAGATVDID